MSLSLGTMALLAGSSLASSGVQYLSNKALQKDAQAFNAREAQLSRDFAAEEAATARAFNAEQAQLSRDFEATKYQRTVADMKAAGINPAFIAGSGVSGSSPIASTGSGVSSAAASSGASSISKPDFAEVLSSAFNTAMVQSFKDEHFIKSLTERTAYQAQKMAFEREKYDRILNSKNQNKGEPEWLDSYVKNFESGVSYL